MQIKIKRIYHPPADDDGVHILVDRLWPRGISKEKTNIDFWAREIAPSDELRKWYQHDLSKWEEFKSRYFKKLKGKQDTIEKICEYLESGRVTFLFSSKELHKNNAVALQEYLLNVLKEKGRESG
jgi:uncharacterized protein YeaO (DUF488 family)